MSKISTIYDLIVVAVESQLTGYRRLPNPYDIFDNPALILKKGYGIRINDGENTKRYVGCITTWVRSFDIIITRQVVNTDSDALGRASIEKEILEAHKLVLHKFESDPSLGGSDIKAEINVDGGIQYISEQDSKYLAMVINLNLEYQET